MKRLILLDSMEDGWGIKPPSHDWQLHFGEWNGYIFFRKNGKVMANNWFREPSKRQKFIRYLLTGKGSLP